MNTIRLLFVITFIFATNLKSQEFAFTVNNEVFNQTDEYMENMVSQLEIVGLNYAVLINNEIAHQRSFGVANAQLQVLLTSDHSFAVASISKLFSSVALHKLMADQKRSVNETVGDFLPNRKDLPDSWKALTLKQILSHTSGIPDQIDYQIYLAPESDEYLINAMKDNPFSSEPGTESKYNATGFFLVRLIIEELAGQDFESHMEQYYFDELGLLSAKYGGFKKVIPNRVTSYQNVGGEVEMFPLNYSPTMYAGAGLNINIKDLTLWFQALLNEEILTREQLKEIWTPVTLNNGENGLFGLGWEAYLLPDHYRMAGHGGAGISSFRHYWNEESGKNVTVIILTNGAKNWEIRPNDLNTQVANIILGEMD